MKSYQSRQNSYTYRQNRSHISSPKGKSDSYLSLLQRTIGNRAVLDLLAPKPKISTHTPAPQIQGIFGLNAAKEQFQKTVNEPEIIESGQFTWAKKLKEFITVKVNNVLAGSENQNLRQQLMDSYSSISAFGQNKGPFFVLISAITDRNAGAITSSRTKIKDILAQNKACPAVAEFTTILGFGNPDNAGKALYQTLTAIFTSNKPANDINTEIAKILQQPNCLKLDVLYGLYKEVEDKCFQMAGNMARFLNNRGGLTGSKTGPPPVIGFPGHHIELKSQTLGHLIRYHGDIKGSVAKMVEALDNGFTVKAGVVSGIYSDHTVKTGQNNYIAGPPDHFLLIIGHETNEFIFWDPDASQSKALGAGFGKLYYAGNILATAPTEANLEILDDKYGHQKLNSDKRYQVISLDSV
jgi:hypothetical protein